MAQGPREAFSQSHSSESGSVLMNHPLKVVLVHREWQVWYCIQDTQLFDCGGSCLPYTLSIYSGSQHILQCINISLRTWVTELETQQSLH